MSTLSFNFFLTLTVKRRQRDLLLDIVMGWNTLQ